MKYCLKDICSITKGATGIMKADGGKYPLVALSDERRSHNEFQFDANAVIVPLISSTGHGHASMKRVHYQEGKFALGNILCAVIPKDETKLNAKYLHLYLQQFKETLLVPLMKGAANVSLPMNKLADVEIEVPSLERQLEIIALEDKAAELKNELEEKLILQDGDITKLRQALLKEAMQGKLTKQNPKDGNAKDLLEKIITEKTKLGIKEKPIAEIKEVEIPFDIPESWVWCRLGKIVLSMTNGIYKEEKFYNDSGVGCFRMYNIKDGKITFEKIKRMILTAPECSSYNLEENDLLLNRVNSIELLGKSALIKGLDEPFVFESKNIRVRFYKKEIIAPFVNYLFQTAIVKNQILMSFRKVTGQASISQEKLFPLLIPLPPLPEQNRIVKKLEELMKLCDDLQASIQASKIENEKLLQGALRDALRKEEVEA